MRSERTLLVHSSDSRTCTEQQTEVRKPLDTLYFFCPFDFESQDYYEGSSSKLSCPFSLQLKTSETHLQKQNFRPCKEYWWEKQTEMALTEVSFPMSWFTGNPGVIQLPGKTVSGNDQAKTFSGGCSKRSKYPPNRESLISYSNIFSFVSLPQNSST